MNEDPEYLALLRRICETPADDAPRLIIADWLEENGEEERAVWIREEVERPRTAIIVSDLTIGATSLHEYAVSWSRGFISGVRLMCAEFCGGPCERCQGSGMSEREYHGVTDDDGGCVKCAGTGRVDGVARELFERHPIVKVVLTDRKTSDVHISGGYRAPSWTLAVAHGQSTPESRICRELYELVRESENCHTTVGIGSGWAACFDTEAAALAALSDACVSYGRELAGLPPLS